MSWPVQIYDCKNDKTFSLDINNAAALIAASNIPYYFPKEALKAQIIMARTYLVRKMRSLGGEGCCLCKEADICNSCHCLSFCLKETLFKEWGKESEVIWQHFQSLMEETDHKIITHNNKPILPVFHKACGGSTENSENIENKHISYLRKTYCDYCQNNLENTNTIDLDIEEIEKRLSTSASMLTWQDGPEIKGFVEEVERDEDGRIRYIKIGNNKYKGQEIADKLGLSSNRFGWRPKVITFESKGIGNGLGVCQFGAKMMCLEGKSAEDIIKYYYTGVEISSLETYNPLRPLYGRKLLLDPGNGAKIADAYYGRELLLNICFEIQKNLTSLGADVCLTRKINEFCSVQDKANVAEHFNPDFYLGINCNYEKSASLSGTEIFHFRGDTESRLLAESILENLKMHTELVQKGIKVAELSLFKEIKTNALLIELGYFSNNHDRNILNKEEQQILIGQSISNGIYDFYSK